MKNVVKRETCVKQVRESYVKQVCKVVPATLRLALPLSSRKRIVNWTRERGLPGNFFLSMELLRDFAETNPNEFHRFLWSHHLAYAGGYKTSRFEASEAEPSRRLLFHQIQEHLRKRNIIPERDVESVFDAGCSLGHVLRFAETQAFPAATRLRGVDVDRYAVDAGAQYLRSAGSKIELTTGDATDLEQVIGQQNGQQGYDIVVCCGVLMYFDEPTATEIVKTLLRHTRMALGLICLAHPTTDNSELERSTVRDRDRGFIHNLDAMIRNAGGRVVWRRWRRYEYEDEDGYSSPYLAIAEPNRAENSDAQAAKPLS